MERIAPVALVHLTLLGLWGGVVAAEAVLELMPHQRQDAALHRATIRVHYWIDLLVELPLIVAVVGSGAALLLMAQAVTALHLLKVGCAGVAVAANLACIVMVLRRARSLRREDPEPLLWRLSRRIKFSAVVGIPFALAASGMGLWLAATRMGVL